MQSPAMNHTPAPSPPAGAPAARHAAMLAARAAHWRQTRRLTALLLALWFGAGFGAVFFARELADITLFGWPLPFYLAAQGSALAFLAILACYALAMRRLDARYRRRMREHDGGAG
ncbi:MAG: sodium/substrate symporter small subunit [Pseudomonadota bacterium]